jgi:hypothetical protein
METETLIEGLLDVIESNIELIETITYSQGGVWQTLDMEPLNNALDKTKEDNRLTGRAEKIAKHEIEGEQHADNI